MASVVRVRVTVAALAVLAGDLLLPGRAMAVPDPQSSPPLTAVGPAPDAGTAVFEGSKRATESPAPAGTNAVGDVTITSQGCSPDAVAFGAQTSCRYEIRNETATATEVNLQASGDTELAIRGADQGAVVTGSTARAEGVALPPRTSSPIQVNPGPTFAGYYALETIPIPPQDITDDQLLNYTVQPYRWNGATYTSIGISANGYAVVGGADTTKDATAAPQDVPDASRPNNVLAPFWTDLTPAGGGSLRVATVANTAQPPCERAYWFVAQWDMFEFGTTTRRKAQLWIQADDPECATDPVPAETIYFTYDVSTMTAPPVRPFRIAAENAAGTVGGMRPAGELPTDHFVVTSSGTPQPAPAVTWTVIAEGRSAGLGTIAATVESSLIPGTATVFTDVVVGTEAAPVVTTGPADRSVVAREQAVFSAAATGATSVRWQVSTDGGGSWFDVAGATASTFAFAAAGGDDGNRYRAVFSTASGVEAATSAAALSVDRIATTASVAPSPAAPAVGQPVTLVAAVHPASATGTVQFAVDGSPLGVPVALAGGNATSPPTSALAAGDHTVTVSYVGDGDHRPASGSETVSVGKLASSIAVEVDPVAPVVGDDVRFTATVAPAHATGTVQFIVDGEPLGEPQALSSATVTSPDLSGLERGTHVVEAAYSGSASHSASASGPVSFAVARRATNTTVQVAPASPDRGDEVLFTATVSPAPGSGTVQFSVDGAAVGLPVPVVGGTVTSPGMPAPAAGEHTVTAAFLGDDTHAPSASAPTPFVVSKRASATTIDAVGPVLPASTDELVVEIEIVPAPTGGAAQVAVDGTNVGEPVPIDGAGRATARIPALTAGSHSVTVAFSGDDDLLPSEATSDVQIHSPNEALVRRLYPLVVGRAADPAGVAYAVGRLDAGVPAEAVVQRLAATAEARRRLIDQAYRRVLGRPADPTGTASWLARLGDGRPAEDILASLLSSPEARRRHGEDVAGTALALFRVHLDRVPGPQELVSWRNRLAADDTPAGRWRAATTFGRAPEAARWAVRAASMTACRTPLPGVDTLLLDRWASSGRNLVLVAGLALAEGCPPDGVGRP